jgi:hypothetical protein
MNSGYNNVLVGSGAGYYITTGYDNVLIGFSAGLNGTSSVITGNSNIYIGALAAPGDTSDANNAIGIGVSTTVIGNVGIAIGRSASVNGNATLAIGYHTSASAVGACAIGTDSSLGGAQATVANQIMLGTANHTVYRAATNTSSGATASTPTIANTATGVQVNATKDVMLYLTCSLAGTGFTLKIGPTSTPAYTLVNNVAVTVGDCFAVRVPGGWYVSWQATTATFANQQAVTC